MPPSPALCPGPLRIQKVLPSTDVAPQYRLPMEEPSFLSLADFCVWDSLLTSYETRVMTLSVAANGSGPGGHLVMGGCAEPASCLDWASCRSTGLCHLPDTHSCTVAP